ncbi:MAG: hypothetical protein ACFFDF_08825 [Candidatus Odinarchaeota archaeon]
MKYKKLSLSLFLLLMIIPINNAISFTYIDNIKNGNYVFFLTDLEIDNNIELNVTHTGSGNFTLFLFNSRPAQSFVNNDKTLNEVIFNRTIAYSLEDNPYINYTASDEKIYYIEIILVNGGPDTFYFTSTITYSNGTLIDKDLTRYYLPIIPGFHWEFLLISSNFSIVLILFLIKNKIKKKDY